MAPNATGICGRVRRVPRQGGLHRARIGSQDLPLRERGDRFQQLRRERTIYWKGFLSRCEHLSGLLRWEQMVDFINILGCREEHQCDSFGVAAKKISLKECEIAASVWESGTRQLRNVNLVERAKYTVRSQERKQAPNAKSCNVGTRELECSNVQ